ncbi:hypothetical protein BaRGS_00015106 [Batillaria attramentaria]|uniref:Histidine N-acetyltransferase C-terminal domain-containing protein n=1 Tax=Batillaria attramentaria TaxID=370345 RepID=A0ABD0L2H7_9CAEN
MNGSTKQSRPVICPLNNELCLETASTNKTVLADTTSSPGDEELCLAGPSDYQAVVDIDHNIYCGFDALPYHYPSFIQGPGVRGYIYKKGNRVVAFVSAHLVDGGQTLTGTSGRLAPDCRGSGTFGRFLRSVYQQYREAPDLRFITTATGSGIMTVHGHRMLKMFPTKILEKVEKYWTIDAGALGNVPVQQPDCFGVRELSRQDVHAMMCRSTDQLRHLFPEGRAVFVFKPYRIMAANTDVILRQNNVFLASGGNLSLRRDAPLFPGTLLTIGWYYTCKRGVCYNIDIYGKGSEEELRAHFEVHVMRWANVARAGETVLFTGFPCHMSEGIEKALRMLPLTASTEDRVVVVEGPYTH